METKKETETWTNLLLKLNTISEYMELKAIYGYTVWVYCEPELLKNTYNNHIEFTDEIKFKNNEPSEIKVRKSGFHFVLTSDKEKHTWMDWNAKGMGLFYMEKDVEPEPKKRHFFISYVYETDTKLHFGNAQFSQPQYPSMFEMENKIYGITKGTNIIVLSIVEISEEDDKNLWG